MLTTTNLVGNEHQDALCIVCGQPSLGPCPQQSVCLSCLLLLIPGIAEALGRADSFRRFNLEYDLLQASLLDTRCPQADRRDACDFWPDGEVLLAPLITTSEAVILYLGPAVNLRHRGTTRQFARKPLMCECFHDGTPCGTSIEPTTPYFRDTYIDLDGKWGKGKYLSFILCASCGEGQSSS